MLVAQLAWKQLKAKDHNEKVLEFQSLHHDRLRLFFDNADLNSAIDNLRTPTLAKQAVIRISAANDLGKALFGETAQTLLSHEVTQVILEEIKKLKNIHLTAEKRTEFVESTHQLCLAVDKNKLLKVRRTCQIKYRGQKVQVRCDTILYEIEAHIAARVKEWAVQHAPEDRKLPLLHFEQQLLPLPVVATPFFSDVDQSQYEHNRKARQQMNLTLIAFKSGGTDTVASTILSKRDAVVNIDKYFTTEIAWLSGMCGAAGEEIMLSRILNAVGNEEGPTKMLADAYNDMSKLLKSPLMQFIGEDVKGQVQSASEIVTSLKLCTAPQFSKKSSTEVVSQVIARCAHFLTEQVPDAKSKESDAPKVTMSGREVLKIRYDELSGLLKDPKMKEKLTGNALDDLRIYWWLCDPVWRANIEIAEGHFRSLHGLGPAATAGGASSSSGPEANVAKKAASSKGKLDRASTLRDSVLARF